MTNEQAHSLSDIKIIDNMSKFEVFSKLVILFLTISSSLSYFLFIFVLGCTYKCSSFRKRICEKPDDPEIQPLLDVPEEKPNSLEPFCIEDEQEISTKLYLRESLYFIALLIINILIWAACLVIFSVYHFNKEYYTTATDKRFKDVDSRVEATVFAMYMYSLLCTIVSCFIFSKVAYSVNHRCLKLYNNFVRPKNPENVSVFRWLVEQDDNFTKMAQQTLYSFEVWFTIHWGFYIATSFLSIALVFDILVKYIQAELETPADNAIGFNEIELVIVALFTLQHCFLFLYPCFKAASVTVGREKLIKKVNAYPIFDRNTLSQDEKRNYIQHLKDKKFGFRISFLCARLRFGFNVAYISIFIGLSGVLLKLTDLF